MKTLQVGKTYKDRIGRVIYISRLDEDPFNVYPFTGCGVAGKSHCYSTKGNYWSDGVLSKYDLIIPDEPAQTTVPTKEEPKVKHLDVILAIVQKIPVQYQTEDSFDKWFDLTDDMVGNPITNPERNWRIKPQPEPKRTVQIGKRTVVAPEISVLHTGCEYFYIDKSQGIINLGVWSEHTVDKKRLELGNIFMLEQDAINCQEAISALLLGKD